MKERFILFSAPMVRAILAGTKTQTRRVVKLKPGDSVNKFFEDEGRGEIYIQSADDEVCTAYPCPYGKLGDRLWVKETHFLTPPRWTDHESNYNVRDPEGNGRIAGYVATMDPEAIRCAHDYKLRQRPSIHMPRWASRLTLEITSVRVERVQEISEADAKAEGVRDLLTRPDSVAIKPSTACFIRLWDSINAACSFGWDANPWVWVVEFKRVPQPAA